MSFHIYSSYKPCNLPYTESVPSHWKLKKIAWDIPYHVGWTPPSGNEDFYGGDIPWVTIGDLNEVSVNSTKTMITRLAVNVRKARIIPPRSLLFSFKLSVGKVAFTDVPCFTNEAIAAFEPNEGVELSFWYHASPLIIPHYGRDNIYGAKLLNQELIGSVKFFCPPKSEQTQIARFLDHETAKIDALIAEQKRLIKLLQEKRQAVISHAVTKGLDPNVPMKDSGVEWLGEVPCHWKIATLRRAIKSVSNGTTATQVDESENTIPVTRIETISSGKINYEKVGHVEKSEVIMPFMLQRGDIILSHINSLSMVGNAAIYDGHKPLAHGMNLLRLKVERLYIDSKWLLHWLKSKSVRQEMESRAKPAINQASISTASIKDVPIPLIPYAEQTQIARFLDHETAKLDELGNQALKSIELMKERRSALISAAVTGKIDVRDWQPPADESAVDEDVQKAGLEASA